MKAYTLREGIYSIGVNGKIFLTELPVKGTIKVGINPFLVITSTDIILFDTGTGLLDNKGMLKIYSDMHSNNISAYDVTKVIISHLHHDHIGGIASFDNYLGCFVANFPNATYYINKNDFDLFFSSDIEEKLKLKLNFLLNDTNSVTFYNGETGSISNNIVFKQTNAHCLYHTVFWVKEDNDTIFYGADDAPQLFQMSRKLITKYDYNPILTAELRAKWWEEGNINNWTFLFYHDISNFIFKKELKWL